MALSSAFLLKPGLAQAFPEVIYPRLIRVHTFQGHPHRDEVRIEFLQVRQCGARFVDLPELGEPGNNVSQSGYVVVVERPGPPADLNCLRNSGAAGNARLPARKAR